MLPTTQKKIDIAVLLFLICVIVTFVFKTVTGFNGDRHQARANLNYFVLLLVLVLLVATRHWMNWLLIWIKDAATKQYIHVRKQRLAAFELTLNRYAQLDDSKQEIRLLTILPGHYNAPIRCTMSTTALGPESSDYEALSYTWGSPLGSREISLDGKSFFITKNLEKALRNLRRLDDPRVIWIDAICINQFDVDERSSQVAIMRHIYREASSVCIWLGSAAKDSKMALAFMQHAAEEGDLFIGNSIGDNSRTKEWLAVRRLFSREYWNRVWIIQEIAMASSIVVQCGEHIIDWLAMVKMDRIWQEQRAVKLASHSAWFEAVEDDNKSVLRNSDIGPQLLDATRKQVSGRQKNRAVDGVASNSLLDLIQTYWMSHATDARDQVYALVGLASDRERLAINIDYKLGLQWVYRDLVEAIYKQTQTVDVIGFAGLAHEDEKSRTSASIQGGASWLPDWSSAVLAKTHLARINRNDRYWAAGDTTAAVKFHEEGEFTIAGSRIGGIWKLGPTSRYHASPNLTISNLERVTQDIKSYYEFAIRSTAELGTIDQGQDSSFFIKSEAWQRHLTDNLANFWRVLICNRTMDGCVPPADWQNQFNALIFGPSHLSEDITSDPGFDTNTYVSPYLEAVLFAMSSRRLFITHGGSFGVGPSDMDTHTDEIVVFLGCNVPMVMRKVWSLPSRHQRLTHRLPELDFLKGWAYVQNCMELEDFGGLEGEVEWHL